MAITIVQLSETFRQFVQKVNTISTNLGDINTIYSDSDVIKTINQLKGFIDSAETVIGMPLSNLSTTSTTSIISAINELDGEHGTLSSLTTTAKNTFVNSINELDGEIGTLSSLTTTEQSNLVASINELDRRLVDVFDSTGTLLNT